MHRSLDTSYHVNDWLSRVHGGERFHYLKERKNWKTGFLTSVQRWNPWPLRKKWLKIPVQDRARNSNRFCLRWKSTFSDEKSSYWPEKSAFLPENLTFNRKGACLSVSILSIRNRLGVLRAAGTLKIYLFNRKATFTAHICHSGFPWTLEISWLWIYRDIDICFQNIWKFTCNNFCNTIYYMKFYDKLFFLPYYQKIYKSLWRKNQFHLEITGFKSCGLNHFGLRSRNLAKSFRTGKLEQRQFFEFHFKGTPSQENQQKFF